MAKILFIETATDVCSVSLAESGKLLAQRETKEGRSHAKILTVFIDELLRDHGTKLDAVAVSKGPGSYTGLRIGVSVAKGLCYAQNIPLIAISTLDSMCAGYLNQKPELPDNALLYPMLDARRMEVYTSTYDKEGHNLLETRAMIIEENSFLEKVEAHEIFLFGSGADKLVDLINHPKITIEKGFLVSSGHMIREGYRRYNAEEFEDLAYFEPFYLKDFITTVPKKNRIVPGA